MRKMRGFNLIELMVVIAIIAILASVALPMYSSFKRRTKASMAIKIASQTSHVLQAWHDQRDSFSGITLNADDLFIFGTDEEVGAVLGDVEGLSWSLDGAPTTSTLRIAWNFNSSANCPSSHCDGIFCINCPGNPLACKVGVKMTSNRFGFDKNESSCGS